MDMKGSGVWIILLLVWICHAMSSGAAEDYSRFVGAPPPPPRYPTVKFMAQGADEASYGAMIARLRELLTSNRESSHGIAMLREASRTGDSERYILLEMSVGPQAQHALTFAINVADVYIVAYHVGRTNTRHFFVEAEEKDENARWLLFPTAETSPRVMSSNYGALGTIAGQGRREIPVGLPNMAHAIREVTDGVSGRRVARALIILIQMVGEAARFRQIEMRIREGPYASFVPDIFMYELENSWQRLSLAVQTSVGSAFQSPVEIGSVLLDDTVSVSVTAGLILMMFFCRPAAQRAAAVQLPLEPHHGLQVMRRSDLEVVVAEAKDECRSSSNPTTRIIGIHGLCVEADRYFFPSRPNSVVLNICNNGDFTNQLWTWRRDGRILSLETGLCLRASHNAESFVVLRECDRLDSGSPDQWDMDHLGTLVHRNTRMVLTVYDGARSERLRVGHDNQGNNQAWKSTNKTVDAQDDVFLIGENNQCIYYSGKRGGVYTEPCSHGDRQAKIWRLYPDGTIRPTNWLNGCMRLTSLDYPTSRYNYIQASRCNRYDRHHRWIFTSEGAIQNLRSRLVVDADKKYPSYLQAAPFIPGAGNQIWRAQFVNL